MFRHAWQSSTSIRWELGLKWQSQSTNQIDLTGRTHHHFCSLPLETEGTRTWKGRNRQNATYQFPRTYTVRMSAANCVCSAEGRISIHFFFHYREPNSVYFKEVHNDTVSEQVPRFVTEPSIFTTVYSNSRNWQIDIAKRDQDRNTFIFHGL